MHHAINYPNLFLIPQTVLAPEGFLLSFQEIEPEVRLLGSRPVHLSVANQMFSSRHFGLTQHPSLPH